jgi:hypothetical protein
MDFKIGFFLSVQEKSKLPPPISKKKTKNFVFIIQEYKRAYF